MLRNRALSVSIGCARRVSSSASSIALSSFVSLGLACSASGPVSTESRSVAPVVSVCAVPDKVPNESAPPPPTPKGSGVAVLPTDYDFSKNPEAVLRIAESPHHYYRFINQPFSTLICRRFAERIKTMPRVELHGDAHLEQYAVTDLGRGLTDLDDTAKGPAMVDLLRMGTSIVLAIHEKTERNDSYRGHEGEVLSELFRGYRMGIDDPDKNIPMSDVDKRLEKKFTKTRTEFLASTENILLPLSQAEDAEIKELYPIYFDQMVRTEITGPKNKERSSTTWALKKVGTIKIGIGSALDQRFVMRLEGRTSAPDDDLIVELKRERVPEASDCLAALRDYGPTRYLMGPVREQHSYPHELPGKPFWSGEWYQNYKEVRIDKTIESVDDLKQVAFESGYVLGRGHIRSLIQSSANKAANKAARASITPSADQENELDTESAKLASEVEEGYMGFRAAAAAGATAAPKTAPSGSQ